MGRRPRSAIGLACWLVAGVSGTAVRADEPDGPAAPRVDGAPVAVTVGFYALDFARVTAREESFDLTGYLELRWLDPSLSRPDGAAGWRPVDPDAVWTPRIYFENALEPPRFHGEPVVEADRDGRVTSWAILSGKFSSSMDLRRFPFDRQAARVRVGAFEDESVVRFAPDPELIQVDPDAFVTDWVIGRPSASVDAHQFVRGGDSYSRFEYRVGLERRPTFYVWRVMLPLTLLAAVSWAAFWFEPAGLQPQISTCMAALIALVAFNFAIDFALPKVAYLTLIDRHALIGFCFVAASVAVVTSIHVAVTRGRLDTARAVQRLARWSFPPAYAATVAANLGVFGFEG